MKAVWYERQGTAREVLTYGALPDPIAGPGEVRVRLQASAVNVSDTHWRRGGSNYPMAWPMVIPNSDGAGQIDQVGAGVAESWVGRRVWLYNAQRFRPFGTAAQYVSLPVDLVAQLPDSVDAHAGATLGIPCTTAHRCVFLAGAVQGRTVLVTGGAGAVGHYAIQLAKWAGATVVATVSGPEKAAHAEQAGADHVIDYRREDAATKILNLTHGEGVDHVVEVNFGVNITTLLAAIRINGSIACYGTAGDPTPKVAVATLMRRNITLHAVSLPTSPIEARRRAQRDIVRWISTGPRIFAIAARFGLAQTAQAHEFVERGGKMGTVVVDIPQ